MNTLLLAWHPCLLKYLVKGEMWACDFFFFLIYLWVKIYWIEPMLCWTGPDQFTRVIVNEYVSGFLIYLFWIYSFFSFFFSVITFNVFLSANSVKLLFLQFLLIKSKKIQTTFWNMPRSAGVTISILVWTKLESLADYFWVEASWGFQAQRICHHWHWLEGIRPVIIHM